MQKTVTRRITRRRIRLITATRTAIISQIQISQTATRTETATAISQITAITASQKILRTDTKQMPLKGKAVS